jgi:hypothetical protein
MNRARRALPKLWHEIDGRTMARSLSLVRYPGKTVTWRRNYPDGSCTEALYRNGYRVHAFGRGVMLGRKYAKNGSLSLSLIRLPRTRLMQRVLSSGFAIGYAARNYSEVLWCTTRHPRPDLRTYFR